jgi:hypothetical protein
MNKSTLDGETVSKEYGSVKRTYSDQFRRSSLQQPYVTFRLHLDGNRKITNVTQNGTLLFGNVLVVLSLIGGLFTSVGASAAMIVKYTTIGQYAGKLTKDLFYVRKYSGKVRTNVELAEPGADTDEKIVASHCKDNYAHLKHNLD